MSVPNRGGAAAQAASGKAGVRRERVAARRSVPVAQRLLDDRARAARVLELLVEHGLVAPSAAVACYLSVAADADRPEPGTLELVEALHRRGVRVLVPKLSPTAAGPRHDPDWAWYAGADDLVAGLWSIPEPSAEGLGAAALGGVDAVLCSALAATPDGRRLGVGGGWFDRALAFARPDALLVALVDDADVVDELPTEPHDRRMDVVVTPTRTIRA